MTNPPALSSEVAAARALLERERHGTLCTAHVAYGGWPFGSIVPYAVTATGDPVVLLASIAEHTRNVAADPRVTLFVSDSASLAKPQSGARAALMARAEVATGPASEDARSVYLERFPEARGHFDTHGFSFFVLRVEHVRWIAGFGAMGWIERGPWTGTPDDPLAAHARVICEHMNHDHPDSLVVLARRYGGVEAKAATMVGLDAKGLDLDVAGRRVRIDFPREVATPEEVRQVVTGMLGHARRG